MPDTDLNRIFSALSDPTRRAIVAQLRNGEALIKDLAEPFDMTLPAVIKHVNILEEAGLITRRQEAQRKPIRLQPEPLKELAAWLQDYAAMWEGRFQQLESIMKDIERTKE